MEGRSVNDDSLIRNFDIKTTSAETFVKKTERKRTSHTNFEEFICLVSHQMKIEREGKKTGERIQDVKFI